MKTLKKIGNFALIIAILVLIGWRLFANKKHYEKEFTLTKAEKLTIPVVTAAVEEKTITHTFTVPAVFKASSSVIIVCETPGQVSEIYVKIGSSVSKGDILAKVDNKIVREQFSTAQQNYEKAKKDLERYQALAKKEAISTSKMEEIELGVKNAESNYLTTLENLENTEIKSPIKGFISANDINVGTWIGPGTPLFEVTNINQLKLYTQLTGEQIKKLDKGMEVKIICDAFPGKSFPGIIYSMNVKSDQSGRFEVIVTMENSKDNRILAGMTGSVSFTSIPEKHLVIPRQAVYGSLKSPSVFYVNDNMAVKQDIKIKSSSSGMLEILEGLNKNDRVVINGHINLKDSTRIKVLSSKTY